MKVIKEPVYYSDYLGLNKILNAQETESSKLGIKAHDEMLFIIIHQIYELWFKQIIHDLDSVVCMFENDYVNEENMRVIVSRLQRITEIQKVMIQQFTVLETMTPLDFLDFRDLLIPASGFQSFQFRIVENKLGLKSDNRLKYNKAIYRSALSEEHAEIVKKLEDSLSLFDLIERWLERTPFLEFKDFKFLELYKSAVENMLNNDKDIIINNPIFTEEEKQNQLKELDNTRENFSAIFDEEKHNDLIKKGLRRLSFKATQAALFINLYRDNPILQLPFKLLTALADIDELFATFRYRHSVMVHRMIGTKIGTGGSSGYNYLKATIESHKVFTDFFNLSTFLIPRSTLPELPEDVKKQLGFYKTYQ
jgi:tryptophan 2,3-dioxygenase